eukprot:7061848-Pyramimonas_sp.AAC.1
MAPTFSTQEAAEVAAAEDAARQRVAVHVSADEAAVIREYVDLTKKNMLAALASVQSSVATLSNTFTTGWDYIENRLEVRINSVENRQSSQEPRIDALEGQIRSLHATIDGIKYARPVPPAAAPGFNRNTDPTILL